MATVQVELPDELLRAAGVPVDRSSQAVADLLELELYRERAVSLGRAAEPCGVSIAEFMEFAGDREVELDFDADGVDQDLRNLENLNP
jgi:predicted HTH domain antitoxin